MLCISAVDNIAVKYVYAHSQKRMVRLQCSDLYNDFCNGLEGREEVPENPLYFGPYHCTLHAFGSDAHEAVDIQAQLSSVQ